MRLSFYIVGSALSEKEPRDVDIYGVMDDVLFKTQYLPPAEFMKEWRKGRKAEETWPAGMKRWIYEGLGAVRVMQMIFPELVPIDFKFIPRSLLQEPNLEVDITKPPSTWGIGFPNLMKHGV